MVPWPIALLTLCYGALTAASAALVWKILSGSVAQPLPGALAWLVVCGAMMLGLPLLKPWARRLAILASAALLMLTLAVAGALVMSGRPGGAVLAALGSSVHVLVMRYLRRPSVKAHFIG